MLRFNVLGQLEIFDDLRPLNAPAPRMRNVLALLAVRANHIVAVNSLVDELWGEKPPRCAVAGVQTYVYQLRRMLEREVGSGAGDILVTDEPGYRLQVRDDQIDARRFGRLANQGRAALGQGQPDRAVELLGRGLALFDGPVLANVTVGRLLEGHVAHLEEERLRVTELRIEAELLLGRHRELVSQLRSLVSLHPMNEWFHEKLILALSRSGRRGEALGAYHDLRRILRDELGVDPSEHAQRLWFEAGMH
jgi:DNA-binding SARP family transcriptional activator